MSVDLTDIKRKLDRERISLFEIQIELDLATARSGTEGPSQVVDVTGLKTFTCALQDYRSAIDDVSAREGSETARELHKSMLALLKAGHQFEESCQALVKVLISPNSELARAVERANRFDSKLMEIAQSLEGYMQGIVRAQESTGKQEEEDRRQRETTQPLLTDGVYTYS
ncbi:hypothetical protein QFC20_007716 [Naganishia adeliensis]|uniref:Uncharacterized protein n=1 Tax=Naganishia adeliensis TaxID=92952 RepID=A0ACC2UWD2_9TREE|nr:hypothetical protein QFC20_007716 [Naganishia adeliensis]